MLDAINSLETAAPITRVGVTAAAVMLIRQLQAKYGDILFHQFGGCTDWRVPMCYRRCDFPLGDDDVNVGTVEGVPYYMSRSQLEYWKNASIIVDAVPGHGRDMSLDNTTEMHFLNRIRPYTDEELTHRNRRPAGDAI